jgi:hypothetical protein
MTAADEAGRSAAPLASPSRASVTSCGRFASFEDWRRDYNEVRPHSALENRTPLEFATSLQGAGIPALSRRTKPCRLTLTQYGA